VSRSAIRLIIEGRVQGVGYRWWALSKAVRLGLDGWVRNRRDGDVEAVFAGLADKVDDMIRVCHRGPEAARVASVQVQPHADDPGKGFQKSPSV
jgi:acylphosphatase